MELDLDQRDTALIQAAEWLLSEKKLLLSRVLFLGLAVSESERHVPASEAEARLKALGLNRDQHYSRQLALIKLIDAGNALGRWSLCLPSQPHKYMPPVSPYVEGVRGYPQIMRAVVQGLAERWPEEMTQDQWIGALIVVVSARGGLHSLSMIRALLNQLDEPRCIAPAAGLVWVDLKLEFRLQEDAERRRWFPEPLCELVLGARDWPKLSRWSELKEKGWPAEQLWRCASAFLLLYSRRLPAKNLTRWLQLVGYYWRFHVPAVVVTVASGKFVSHALTPTCWARLQGGWVEEREPELQEVQETDEQMPDEGVGPIPNRWMSSILAACDKETKAQAVAAIRVLSSTWPEDGSSRHLIACWAVHLLQKGGALGQSLHQVTVKKYLSLAGRRLANITGSERLLDLDVDEWGELYESILELARSVGHRKYLAKTLNAWHRFLVAEMGVPDINASEVLGLGGTRTPVDAVVISLDEFLRVREKLLTDPALSGRSKATTEVAWMVMTLGFRCGLRRSEVLGLRVRDVHLLGRPEIIVRPHSKRRLKSRSGTRKLPVWVLLDADELEALTRLVERRREEGGADALLMDLQAPGSALGQSFLIPKIHGLMREVTGDPSVRFHHLRHSFATWTLLRLLLADRPIDLTKYLHQAPRTAKWVSGDPVRFRRALLGITDGTTRKSAYAVSRLLGHSAVKITTEHYAHFYDLLWAESSRSLSPAPRSKVVLSLLDLPKTTGYRLGAHRDIRSALSALRSRQLKLGVIVCPFRERPNLVAKEGASTTSLIAFDDLYKSWWAFIVQASRLSGSESMEPVCNAHNISMEEGRRLLQLASNLASLNWRGLPRHPVLEVDSVPCMVPPLPYRVRDEKAFSAWANILGELIEKGSVGGGPSETAEVLDFWAHNAWGTRTWMPFSPRKYQHAESYVRLLSQLVGPEGFEVMYCDEVTQRVQRRVNKILGLPQRREVLKASPTNPESVASRQTIIVRPVHERGDDAHDTVRSWRLVLYMAHIHSALVFQNSGIA